MGTFSGTPHTLSNQFSFLNLRVFQMRKLHDSLRKIIKILSRTPAGYYIPNLIFQTMHLKTLISTHLEGIEERQWIRVFFFFFYSVFRGAIFHFQSRLQRLCALCREKDEPRMEQIEQREGKKLLTPWLMQLYICVMGNTFECRNSLKNGIMTKTLQQA